MENLNENTFLLSAESCRRAFERACVDVPVVLIATTRGTTSFHEARTADLSEGGMGVFTSAPLTPNQPISVEFTIPMANQLLKLRATVKHQRAGDSDSSSDDRYGLEFFAATLAQRNQIRRIAEYAC